MPAANDKYGSDRAEPTRWVAWADTLPPSWSLKIESHVIHSWLITYMAYSLQGSVVEYESHVFHVE